MCEIIYEIHFHSLNFLALVMFLNIKNRPLYGSENFLVKCEMRGKKGKCEIKNKSSALSKF